MRWQLVIAAAFILPSFFHHSCFALQDFSETGLHVSGGRGTWGGIPDTLGFTASSPTTISGSSLGPTGATAAASAEASPFTNSLEDLFSFSVTAQTLGGGSRASVIQYLVDSISLVGINYSGDITLRFTVDGIQGAETNGGIFPSATTSFLARPLNIDSAFSADVVARSNTLLNQFGGTNVVESRVSDRGAGPDSLERNFEELNASPAGGFVGVFDFQYSINSTSQSYDIGVVFGGFVMTSNSANSTASANLTTTVGIDAVFDENGNDISEFAVFNSGATFSVPNSPVLGDVNLDGAIDFSDIPAFIAVLSGGGFQAEADCDLSGTVDFSDIPAFIAILINQ